MTPIKTGVIWFFLFERILGLCFDSWYLKKLLACCSLGAAGLSAVLQSAKPMYNSSQQFFFKFCKFLLAHLEENRVQFHAHPTAGNFTVIRFYKKN